eukprot:1388364-Amorphochlora_amoeboformis.AAC.1
MRAVNRTSARHLDLPIHHTRGTIDFPGKNWGRVIRSLDLNWDGGPGVEGSHESIVEAIEPLLMPILMLPVECTSNSACRSADTWSFVSSGVGVYEDKLFRNSLIRGDRQNADPCEKSTDYDRCRTHISGIWLLKDSKYLIFVSSFDILNCRKKKSQKYGVVTPICMHASLKRFVVESVSVDVRGVQLARTMLGCLVLLDLWIRAPLIDFYQ